MPQTWDELNKQYGSETPNTPAQVTPQTQNKPSNYSTWDAFNSKYENYTPPEEIKSPEVKTAPTFVSAKDQVPNEFVGGDAAGFTHGGGHGTPFDFHIVTPKFSVKEDDSGLAVAGKQAFNVVSTVGEGLFNTMNDIFDFSGSFIPKVIAGKAGIPDVVEGGAKTIRFGTSALNLAFAPISTELTAAAASGVPVVSQLAQASNYVFGKLGDAGKWLAGGTIDNLVSSGAISKETGAVYKQPIEELGAIGLQLLAAKAAVPLAEAMSGGKTLKTNLVKQPDGSYSIMISSEPTNLARLAQVGGKVASFAMAPVSEMARTMTNLIKSKMAERKAAGLDVNNPDVAKGIVNEVVKEVPADIPANMKIIKTDDTGKPTGQVTQVFTNQKLVLQNFIRGQEDINYKVAPDLGKDPGGAPITSRFEWDYKTQTGTMYVTKASTAVDLAHELGHYFDRTLSSEIGTKLSEVVPDYSHNRESVNASLAGYAIDKLGGNAPKKKIDAEVKKLATGFEAQVRRLAAGEKRGMNEQFAEAVKEVIRDPQGAQAKAPDFSAFIKYSLRDTGILKKMVKEMTKGVNPVTKPETKPKQRGTFVEEKKNPVADYVKAKKVKFRTKEFKTDEPISTRAIRYSQKGLENTDSYRGGTWYSTPESKSYDFSKEFKGQVGGDVKTEKNLDIKKPLVIKNAIAEDGSFAVINSGYENWLPPLERKMGNDLWDEAHNGKDGIASKSELKQIFQKFGGKIGMSSEEIKALSKGTNGFDILMDRIISRGLKKEGYDALVLENEHQGKVLDRHIFKFSQTGTEKFRTEPIKQDLTTRLLEKLKGHDSVSKQFIEDLTNSADIKKPERELIRSVLAGETGKVTVKDFIDKVKTELLPLKVGNSSEAKKAIEKELKLSVEQTKKLADLNKKIFGDSKLKIIEQILTPEGMKALGSYREGIIKIVNGKADAKDTFYHEAVHKYMDHVLGFDEHVKLLTAAQKKYGLKDLSAVEEKLAEDFISYAKSREGVTGRIKTIFDTLIQRIKAFTGNQDAIKSAYADIIGGKGAKQGKTGGKEPVRGTFVDQPIKPATGAEKGQKQAIPVGSKVKVPPFKGKKLTTAAFNESKINAPEDVVRVISDIAEKNNNFGQQRRSATLDEMKTFALKYLGDEKLYKDIPSSIRENIGRMKAAQQTMVDMATDLVGDLKNTDMATASPEQVDVLKTKLVKLEQVSAAFSGARTEASHLFSSLKTQVTAGENNILKNLFSSLKEAGLDSGNIEEFFKKKEKILYETKGEAYVGVWYSFLLSGPTTFIKNAVSTAGSVVAETLSATLRNPKEGISAIPDLWNGLKEGWGMAKEVATGKRPGAAELGKFTHTTTQKIPYEFKGKEAFLNHLRIVGRLLSASDTIFNEGLRQMELSSLKAGELPTAKELMPIALERAKKDGFTGQAKIDKAAEYVKTPEILLGDLASKFALRGTFNDDPTGVLGAISRGISQATRDVPALKFIAPFTRVVANVVSRGIDYTPYGFTRTTEGGGLIGGKLTEFVKGEKATPLTQRQFVQQMSRATAGTLFMALGFYLATQDRLSGDGPKNFAHKQQLLDAGWRANSIKIGNTWFPIINFGPLALPLAIAANSHESMKYDEIKQDDWSNRVAAAVSGSGATIFSMSFLSGVNDFMDIIKSDDPKKLQTFLGRSASSLVAPNLFKQIGRIFDPTVYQANNVWEKVLSDTRLTGGLKPQLNVFGEPVIGDRLTQLQPSTEKNDPVMKFLGDNQLWISLPGKNTQIRLGGTDRRAITPDEYYTYVKESGPLIHDRLESKMDFILRQPTQERMQKAVNDVVDTERNKVLNQIQRDARNQ